MSETTAKTQPTTFNLIGMAIDVALAGGMFMLFFLFIIPEHVPVYDETWKTLITGYTSAVMGGFWFLFFTLFRVTLVDQLRKQEVKVAWVNTLAKVLYYK